MNHTKLIDELLQELSYRVGIVDIYNKEHQSIISEILTEWGEFESKEKIFKFLNEADDTEGDDKDYEHIGKGFYVKSSDKGKEGAQKYKKDDNGNLKPVSADEYEKEKDEQGEEGEDAASSSPQNQQGGDGESQQEPPQGQSLKQGSYQDVVAKEKETRKKLEKEKETNTSSDFNYETTSEENLKSIKDFVDVGFDNSKGAPGNRGSMLNETTSIISSTEYLNSGQEFNFDEALSKNVEMLKDSKLGEENDGDKPAGRVKMSEAKEIAQKHGISVGLAAKILIATRSAKKKHDRVKKRIIEKNNLTNYQSVPLFGDAKGLQTQRDLVNNAKGIVKLGSKEISKEEAIEIINAGGGGKNPSDTAIFVVDKDTGNLHMTFFSDKDATNAIVAQSSLTAENELKKKEIDELVKDGLLSEEDSVYYKSQMDTAIKQFQELEESLSKVVNGPGEHLQSQNIDDLVNTAKTLSAGSNPEKYWKKAVVAKFTSTRNPAYKTITPLLPEGHSNPPTDKEMMEAYVKWINLEENQGNLSKDDQRVVTDLSNKTNGPKLGAALGEIRKKSISADLELIKKLDEKKVMVNGKEVGLGTYLEAKSVSEKLHLDMLFGGEGVYQDEDAFCQENGGVTVTKEVLASCLPFKNQDDFVTHFEVGEEVDQIQRGGKVVTGGSKIVYALTKEGERFPIGEKKQRSKQGPLGKLSTVYNFHPELQKCLDKNGK